MAARAFGTPGFCVEGSSLLAPRVAKRWWGRTAQRALAVARAFGPPRFCVEGSLLVSRGAKPWQGRTLEGSGGRGARFWTPAVLLGRVVTFGLEGRGTVAGAYSRGLRR